MGEWVTCEVCDTVQPPATLCQTCGLRLHLPEGTVLEGDPPIEVPPDIERSRDAPVGEVEVDPPPGLVSTAGDEFAELMQLPETTEDSETTLPPEGLEPTAEPFERTAVDPVLARFCPYCRQPAAGRVCDRCGWAISRVLPPAPAHADEADHCPSCGARQSGGSVCRDCGAPMSRSG